jgi:UDP-N-acetylglucosamine 2-epimerase (non-hydrolysing)
MDGSRRAKHAKPLSSLGSKGGQVLWFSAGTAGELIKIYPLLRMAQEKGQPFFCLCTGQSGVGFYRQWDLFRLPSDRLVSLLDTNSDLKTSAHALTWFTRAMLLSAAQLRRKIAAASGGVLPNPERDFWLVHGDTLSTLVGSVYARRLRIRLAHVEAGLRSSQLFKPFPEEITRRLVSRFARHHFTQDQRAYQNLISRKIAGAVVDTGGNTLIDAIRYARREPEEPDYPAGRYAVANLHRFENLHSPSRWEHMLKVLEQAAAKTRVLLVLHPPVQEKLDREPAMRARLERAGVILLPRQPFVPFIKLLARSAFVISDGGSNQEECHYLGKPCLILRDATERMEGLDGGSCVLSRFDPTVIERFLEDPSRYQRPETGFAVLPSERILDTLRQ